MDTKMNVDEKRTFLETGFWLKMIEIMDIKTRYIAEAHGFGKIRMEFIVQDGKVIDVVFNDEFRVRANLIKSSTKGQA